MTHDNNSGTIFRNDYKTADKHPDYKGKCNVDGKLYDIALWLRQSKDKPDVKFFSVKFSEPRQVEYQNPLDNRDEPAKPDPELSDLPF